MDIIYLMKKEMLRRHYSLQTGKAYVFCMKKFLKRCYEEAQEDY